MIRAADLPSVAAALGRDPVAAPRADMRDPFGGFDSGTPTAQLAISGNVSNAARGLSVQQHAERVLSHLTASEREPGL
jgi:hypothetical protein